ncbi:hypothetical protein BDD12DRAFT_804231 [Trichophaea hybrida]|nr:hypothetical protein BDD12DRAFT_804231 [Trichophaea hybrida]
MDQNGESDTNSMVLDPVSPGSNNSRDMLDEPAAPRRNSTDDNDTTRPRKRPAVMAGSEEQRENLAISPQLRHSDASDGSEPRLPVVESSTKSTTESTLEAAPEASRTIQIRAPQAQTGNGEMQDIPVEPDFKSHDALKRTLSQSPELPHSDGDSDSHTLRSTSPEVEEVEMDVNEDLSYHIKQMDPGTDSSDFIDDSEDSGDVLNRIATAFEKSECPIRELEEISIAISRFVSAVNVDPSRFEHLFLGQSELCESLPTLVENLLTREMPFDAVFYERDGLRHITQFFANFVRLAALIIQYEASKLATIPVEEEIQLFAEAYLATINSMLRSGHLYVIINHAGFHITDTFPDVIRSFVGPEGFLASFKSLAAIVYERIPSQPRQPSLVEHLGSVALQILKTLQMATAADIKNKILRHITEYWAILEAALSDILESHVQAVDIKEFLGRLEDFSSLAAQIHHLQPTNPKLSPKLRECLSKSNSYMEPKAKSLMLVVEWAHKFPFYYKMLCTSRMDIRLRGLVAMTDTLLAVWKEYHVRTWEDAPILRFCLLFIRCNLDCVAKTLSAGSLLRFSLRTGF